MSFWAREKIDDKELHEELKKMQKQIKAVGGQLTFNLKIDNEGWIAKCKEFDAIIAGGKNTNPTEEEIMHTLIDAIKTAFHVQITKLEIKKEQPISKLPTIKVVQEREFQFC